MSEHVFVDTSAILALLVPTDRAHPEARRSFERLGAARAPLITNSYVMVETYALLQRRLGLDAVRAFREEFAPLLDVLWVNEETHERALDEMLSRPAALSLVDASSFVLMRSEGIHRAFAFDRHFEAEGSRLD